jgi:hypothetical protein
MAKLTTKNKYQVYNSLKSEYYKNINDVMQKHYQSVDGLTNAFNDEKNIDIGRIFKGAAMGPALIFDLLGGALGTLGNIGVTLVKMGADFADNVYNAFDPNDDAGFFEDMGFAISNLGGDMIKGIGTGFIGLGAGVGTFLGDESAQEKGAQATRALEEDVNRVIGSATRAGRLLDKNIKGENSPLEKLSNEGFLDSNEEVRKYISDKHDPESFASLVKQSAVNVNTMFQSTIIDFIKNDPIFDKMTKDSYAGEIYKNLVEPAAQSIGEIIPAMTIGRAQAGAKTPEAAARLAMASKAFFIANAYGRSYTDAINQGAAENDANIYAIGMAGIELATEQISTLGGKFLGGFGLGQPLATSYKSVLKSIATEGFEEFVAEISQPTLEVFLSEERDASQVSPDELRQRAIFSALVGGISGGVFGGIGMMEAKTDINADMQVLNEQFQKNAQKRDPKAIGQSVKGMVDKLNKGNIPQWRVDQMMSNPMYSTMIVEKDGKYELTSVGQRMAQGQVFAQQGDKVITKEEYAVGSNEYAIDYLNEIQIEPAVYDVDGNIVQEAKSIPIQIQTNEQVKKLDKKTKNDIKFLQDNNIRFALFSSDTSFKMGNQAGSLGAFVDPNTGMVYINGKNKETIQLGLKSIFSHEIHDKINLMYNNGLLTKKQFEAYQQFENEIDTNKLDAVLKEIGWYKKEAFYRERMFTPQQSRLYTARVNINKGYATLDKAQQEALGYDSSMTPEENAAMSIELNETQKQFIKRERVSNVIDTVFDSETILRRAMQKNPSIFRKIANIFAKPEKFKTVFKFSKELKKDSVLQDMLNNMQVNFTNVLKQGMDFIYGPETILDGMMQTYNIQRPSNIAFKITNNEHIGKKIYDVASDEAMQKILNSEEAMNEIIGYKNPSLPKYIFDETEGSYYKEDTFRMVQDKTEGSYYKEDTFKMVQDKTEGSYYKDDSMKKIENPSTIQEINANIDADYFNKNKPEVIPKDEQQFYKETTGKNYFFRVGKKLYNKDDFSIPQGATNVKISYVDNNYFRLDYDYSPMEGDANIELSGTLYSVKEIYPDVELNDGTIVEKPLVLVSSLNKERLDFFVQNKISPFGSINMQSATAMTLGTNAYESVIEGEDGHKFTISMFYNPNIIESNGFLAYRNDIYSMVLKAKVGNDNEFINDLYNDLVSEKDNDKFVVAKIDETLGKASFGKEFDGNNYLLVEYKNKARVLQTAINTMISQSENQINEMLDDSSTIETISKNLDTLMSTMDRISKTETTKMTRESLKKDVMKQHRSPKEVLEAGKKATIALKRMLLDTNIGVRNLGRALAIEIHGNRNFERDVDIFSIKRQYQKELKDIADFLGMYQYNINSVAEAQHPKIEPSMVSGAFVTHIGGNKNSRTYQQYKKFFSENDIVVRDLIQEKSVEEMIKDTGFNFSESEFYKSPQWVNRHIDSGKQSLLDEAQEVATQTPILFKVSVDKTNASKNTKAKAKNREAIVDTTPVQEVEESEAIIKTKTPKTKKTLKQPDNLVVSEDLTILEKKMEQYNAQWIELSLARRKANQEKNKVKALAFKKRMESLLESIKLLEQNIERVKKGESIIEAKPQETIQIDAQEIRRTRIEQVRALNEQIKDARKSLDLATSEDNQVEITNQTQRINDLTKQVQDLEALIEGTQTQQALVEQEQAPVETQEAQPQVQETTNIEQRKEEIVQEVMDLVGTWSEQQTRTYLETQRVEQGMEVPLQNSKLNDLADEYSSLLEQDVQAETQQEAPIETPQEAQQRIDAQTPPPAPIQQTQQVDYSALEKAQQIARAQTKEVYKKLNKSFKNFLKDIFTRVEDLNEEEAKNLVKLYKQYQKAIDKEPRANKMYNHMTSAVLKSIIEELGIIYDRASRAQARTDFKLTNPEIQRIIDRVNESIFSTIQYLNDIKSERYVLENSPDGLSNPEGLLYAKFSHWYLRDLLDADLSDVDTLKKFAQDDTRGDFYRRLLNAIQNINNDNGFNELFGAIEEFYQATDIDQTNDLALNGDRQRTLQQVMEEWYRNLQNINNFRRNLKYNIRPPFGSHHFIDPNTYLQIQGLFNENGWGPVIYRKLVEAQENMIKVDRIFNDIMQDQDYIKKNFKELKKLDKTKVKLENIEGAELTISQIIFLRNMMVREIARNKAIDMELIDGNKSSHFQDGFQLDILDIDSDSSVRVDKQTQATIVSSQGLLTELDTIIKENEVANDFNQRVLDLFSKYYPLINERYIELNGQPLQNEGVTIKEELEQMDDAKKQEFFDSLPDSINIDNIDKIYTPLYIGQAGYFREDSPDIKAILDLGVFDGFTQSITDNSTSPVKVDTIQNVVFKYTQEVKNFYGLHRVMKDWNRVTNEKIDIKGVDLKQDVNMKNFMEPQAIAYVENLMKSMAGYNVSNLPPLLKKTFSLVRRNFYRQALGLNLKVIFSQLTTMQNLSILYGGNSAKFYTKMYKNLFAQFTKENKMIIDEMIENNDVMYDRQFNPTVDFAESQGKGILRNHWWNRLMNLFMSGIGLTDNMINKAFYLSLLETKNPETGRPYTKEEADVKLKEAILVSQSTALQVAKAPILRTESDIIKMFVKFLGEPNKLQNQVYLAKKKLDYVIKVEKNEQKLVDELDSKEAKELLILQEERVKLNDLAGKEESDDFATLENDEQQAIRDAIKKQKDLVAKQEKTYEYVQREVEEAKQSIVSIIADKSNIKERMIRSSAAIVASMTRMAMLGIAWGLLRTDFGTLDDREEDEELLQYIMRKFGIAMAGEFVGGIPLARDIYSFMFDGYSFTEIDEIAALEDSLSVVRKIFVDVQNGKELNLAEIGRDIAIYGGRLTGAPIGNLEGLIVRALITSGNNDLYYKYREATGQRTSSNKELAKAIAEGDDAMVEAIIETRMASRDVNVSNSVMDEVIRLARLEKNISLTGINDTYTIDGVEYKLEDKDKARFRSIYNQADFILQRMIASPRYRRLNDEKKKSLITSIYTYYLKLAQQTIFEVDVLPESRTFRTLNQVFRYFSDTVVTRLYDEQMKERQGYTKKVIPITTFVRE